LISSIGKGLLVFAGVGKDDTEKEAENLVNKVLKAKFWPDENGAQVGTPHVWRFASICSAHFVLTLCPVEEERTGYRRRSALWYVDRTLEESSPDLLLIFDQSPNSPCTAK
jgi:hypothetical protein